MCLNNFGSDGRHEKERGPFGKKTGPVGGGRAGAGSRSD